MTGASIGDLVFYLIAGLTVVSAAGVAFPPTLFTPPSR